MGNASPGTIKVVVLGPKFEKKFARQTSATRPPAGMTLYPNPKTQNIRQRIAKPEICRDLRPIVSIVMTESQ